MQEQTKKTLRTVYTAAISTLTFAVGAAFIVQVWRIYVNGGSNPYTPEAIARHFKQITWLLCLWGACFVAGLFIEPPAKQKLKAAKNTQGVYTRLYNRLPRDLQNGDMQRLQKQRKTYAWALFAIALAFILACAVLLLNKGYTSVFGGEFFTKHTEAEKMLFLTATFIIVYLVCLWLVKETDKSYEQEITVIKEALVQAKGAPAQPQAQVKVQPKWKQYVVPVTRIAIAVIGVTLVIVGICNGGMADVLEKAINICTQCIGLG